MSANDSHETSMPRDAEYFLLVATNDWLKMEKVNKYDKAILSRKTEEAVKQWCAMNHIEKTIFINRVLYEYWSKGNMRFATFFEYRNFIRGKAEDIRTKQQNSSRSKEYTRSSGKSCNRIDDQLANAYVTLGIPSDADRHLIKNAYRELIKIHHPDHGGNERVFIKVRKAYEILKNKEAS